MFIKHQSSYWTGYCEITDNIQQNLLCIWCIMAPSESKLLKHDVFNVSVISVTMPYTICHEQMLNRCSVGRGKKRKNIRRQSPVLWNSHSEWLIKAFSDLMPLAARRRCPCLAKLLQTAVGKNKSFSWAETVFGFKAKTWVRFGEKSGL